MALTPTKYWYLTEKGIEKEIRRIEDDTTLTSAATAKSFLPVPNGTAVASRIAEK